MRSSEGIAIVTGASRGIGQGIAHKLAESGTHVVLVARDEAAMGRVAATIAAAGGSASSVPADMSEKAAPQTVIDRVLADHGRIDIVVNNAGRAPQSRVEDTSDDEWASVLDLNLNSVFRIARAVGPVFGEAGHGRMINIGSVFGLLGRSGFSAYGASKGALSQLTRNLAAEWARSGAQVNTVAPGYISTDINVEMRADEEFVRRVLSRIPARRLGEVDEVANLVHYLALGAPDFLTGQTIAIDGGESTS